MLFDTFSIKAKMTYGSSISLAWNSIGLQPDHFSGLCSAISLNGHIQTLDLPHNQLSPSNGKTLSDALKSNGSVRSVDLRSNHIGCSGGSALLKMLRTNCSLTRIKLSGNMIPMETLDAIGTSIVDPEMTVYRFLVTQFCSKL